MFVPVLYRKKIYSFVFILQFSAVAYKYFRTFANVTKHSRILEHAEYSMHTHTHTNQPTKPKYNNNNKNNKCLEFIINLEIYLFLVFVLFLNIQYITLIHSYIYQVGLTKPLASFTLRLDKSTRTQAQLCSYRIRRRVHTSLPLSLSLSHTHSIGRNSWLSY